MEASPEQMARCSAQAERFSAQTGVLTRIIGWYHSHPHITVHPSHVDVRTQVCAGVTFTSADDSLMPMRPCPVTGQAAGGLPKSLSFPVAVDVKISIQKGNRTGLWVEPSIMKP